MLTFSSLKCIEEDDESFDIQEDGEVLERKSPSLVQFTRSISAINSMSLGVQVLTPWPWSPRVFIHLSPSEGTQGKKSFFESPGSSSLNSRGLQETRRGSSIIKTLEN